MAARNEGATAWTQIHAVYVYTQRTQALFQAIRYLLDNDEVDNEMLQDLAALGIAESDTILSTLQETQNLLAPGTVAFPLPSTPTPQTQEGTAWPSK